MGRFLHGLEDGHHAVEAAWDVFRVLLQVYEEALKVEGRAAKVPKRRGQRWATRTARSEAEDGASQAGPSYRADGVVNAT